MLHQLSAKLASFNSPEMKRVLKSVWLFKAPSMFTATLNVLEVNRKIIRLLYLFLVWQLWGQSLKVITFSFTVAKMFTVTCLLVAKFSPHGTV